MQNKGRKVWPKDTFLPGALQPNPVIPSSWSPGFAEGWFLCKSLWIQICDSSSTAGGTRVVFRFGFWYSQHGLLFLPLLKKTAIFDNIPLWDPDLPTEGKHWFRWEHYISFGWLYVHLRSWLQARKTEFSRAPIFQGLTHHQTFPSFATSQQNIDNCVWKGRFWLQNNPRTLTAIVCGSPLPPFIFTSSQGWQRAAAATNQPGEGGEIPGAPSPFPVSWNPQTFLFTLDHHNRFTAITSSSVNNTYSV